MSLRPWPSLGQYIRSSPLTGNDKGRTAPPGTGSDDSPRLPAKLLPLVHRSGSPAILRLLHEAPHSKTLPFKFKDALWPRWFSTVRERAQSFLY